MSKNIVLKTETILRMITDLKKYSCKIKSNSYIKQQIVRYKQNKV